MSLVLPVVLGCDRQFAADHMLALEALAASFAVPSLDHIVSAYASEPAAAAWWRDWMGRHEDLAGVCAYFQQNRTAEDLPYTTTDLAALEIPTTIVAGCDAVHPAEIGHELATILPDAELVELEGVPQERHEAAIATAFIDHLERISRGYDLVR